MPDVVAKAVAEKELLPTDLSSAEIRAKLPQGLRERAIFSARVSEARVLKRMREVVTEVAAGRMNNAAARAELLDALDEAGYDPVARGDTGMRNLRSRRRLDLIIDTNRQMAAGAAMTRESAIARKLYPAWRLERVERRLERVERRRKLRDWDTRWAVAGEAVGWEGACREEFVARKDSPIWAELGSGSGVFKDTLGNAFPPFAFNSGMSWAPVSAEEAEGLGLGREAAAPAEGDLTPGQAEVRDAAKSLGFTAEDFLEDD